MVRGKAKRGAERTPDQPRPSAVPRRATSTDTRSDTVVTGTADLPFAAVALRLLSAIDAGGLIYLAADERRAEDIGRVLSTLAPASDVMVFPPWDCLPFDRASPSRESMGRRVAVLQRVREAADTSPIVITSVEAVMQRTPPFHCIEGLSFAVVCGESCDREALARFAERVGYVADERVTEPGEINVHGQIVEVFPCDSREPVRIEFDADHVTSIHLFDPVTLRSMAAMERLVLRPASEILPRQDEDAPERNGGGEHRLPDIYGEPLPSLFDALPEAQLFSAPGTEQRRETFLEQLAEAGEAVGNLRSEADPKKRPADPHRLYLDDGAWRGSVEGRRRGEIVSADIKALPGFVDQAKPVLAFEAHLEQTLAAGRRVVLAGVPRDLKAFARHLRLHDGQAPTPITDWASAVAGAPGSFFSLDLDLDEGVADVANGIELIAAADVLGTRAHHRVETGRGVAALVAQPVLKIGDTVIHEDHGVGILRGLEDVVVGDAGREAVRIEYHGGASVLVPVEDLDRVWRYGSDEEAVSLDRLNTEGWAKRRIEIETTVLRTARELVSLAEEQRSRDAPKLAMPDRASARIAARFPYPLTTDQTRAIAAVTEDLASGHPMDRLVCGDVGFGKTEVAIRAAMTAMLAGKQVALVAPTTVLARQHLETFRKRCAGMDFEIAGLSRLETTAESKRVKAGLADGSVHMVVGTQAVAAADVAFHDLGLLIIDEEQKFGAKLKAGLRDRAKGGHVLTLTATPIPRTLQTALVGIQTVSVIATPPVRRRPVRTFVSSFDPATMRGVLMREHARGGQSFVVVPRIEDIEPLRARLAEIVPKLKLRVAHGELSAEDVDDAMVDFAHGRGDVLLATNIVESGLDVPRANTMLVWDAGRFGLAQLHQLRGRVGRGRHQAVAYLLTDPANPLGESADARLAALAGLDRLGAGFAISARDLDLRGAGDLVGDQQAGHMRLIGLELYQNLLARAVRRARGATVDDRPPPELRLDRVTRIPDAYVTEPDLRLELYARLCRLRSGKEIRTLRAEVEDRFGALPPEVEALFAYVRLRSACRRVDAAALSVGPRSVALTLHPEGLPRGTRLSAERPDVDLKGAKLVWTDPAAETADALERADAIIELLEGAPPAP